MSTTDRYADAGVDLSVAERAKARIAALVRGTRTGASVGAVGGFGGLVRVPKDVADPVLVASTDGVGTKVLVAIHAGRHDSVGEDLVNHCVNDILVHGARPLGFLDYFATGRLDAAIAEAVVSGVARGCRAHGMPLVGGETAEMPDVYREGEYDLAGTIIGVVSERDAPARRPGAGRRCAGGVRRERLSHQRVLAAAPRPARGPEARHRRPLSGDRRDGGRRAARRASQLLRGHLAGAHHGARAGPHHRRRHSGQPGPRAPRVIDAIVRPEAWPVPVACRVIQEAGHIADDEMRRVFNLGVGMIAVCADGDVASVRAARECRRGRPTWVIGTTVRGSGAVRFEP